MTDLMSNKSVYRFRPSSRGHYRHGTNSNGLSGWVP